MRKHRNCELEDRPIKFIESRENILKEKRKKEHSLGDLCDNNKLSSICIICVTKGSWKSVGLKSIQTDNDLKISQIWQKA